MIALSDNEPSWLKTANEDTRLRPLRPIIVISREPPPSRGRNKGKEPVVNAEFSIIRLSPNYSVQFLRRADGAMVEIMVGEFFKPVDRFKAKVDPADFEALPSTAPRPLSMTYSASQ